MNSALLRRFDTAETASVCGTLSAYGRSLTRTLALTPPGDRCGSLTPFGIGFREEVPRVKPRTYLREKHLWSCVAHPKPVGANTGWFRLGRLFG